LRDSALKLVLIQRLPRTIIWVAIVCPKAAVIDQTCMILKLIASLGITCDGDNIKSESDFYPWGGELQFVSNDSNHYKFTGKERDAETQLDYFGARYYSNRLGRWVSADWSATPVPVPYAVLDEPQTLNLDAYVAGNPLARLLKN
jgi:RHS repeat-associated protein